MRLNGESHLPSDSDHGAARRWEAGPAHAEEAAARADLPARESRPDATGQHASPVRRLFLLLVTDAAWGVIVLAVVGAAVVLAV